MHSIANKNGIYLEPSPNCQGRVCNPHSICVEVYLVHPKIRLHDQKRVKESVRYPSTFIDPLKTELNDGDSYGAIQHDYPGQEHEYAEFRVVAVHISQKENFRS